MAQSIMSRDIEPCQSFLVAAKYDFMAQNIKTRSLVYLGASQCVFSKNDLLKSEVCVAPPDEYNTHKDTSVTADKPYKCDKCPYSFSHNYKLKRHELCHIGVKPYECRTCHKKFTRAGDLKRHGMNYECGTCHK